MGGMNVASLSEAAAERFGDYRALWFEGRWYSSGELHRSTQVLSGGLRHLGVTPGDRVVVSMMNCPEVGVTYGGLWRAGAAVVPVLFLLTAEELRHILRDSGAVAVVTTPELLAKVREAAGDVAGVRHIIVVDGATSPDMREVNFAEVASGSPDPAIHDAAPDDVAVVFYTSGTTGNPKGVLLSHANLLAMAENAQATHSFGDGQVGLACLPLAHAYGISAALASSYTRGTGVMMRWFDAGEALRLIEEFRVTITALVPTMMVFLLAHPEAATRDTSSLAHVISGGAALPLEVQRDFEKHFGCTVLQGYGLSESAAQCSMNTPDANRTGSVGRPVHGVEVAIVGEDGRRLPAGELGEIVIRGDNVMLGYHRMGLESAQAVSEGWLHTGDVGRLDEDGFLYVVDRKKDLIIRGGFNILPRDVEEVLHQHPAVAQAAVIGVPDPAMGEHVRAYVVLNGTAASPDELLAFCRGRLAAYKCPSSLVVAPSLPINAIGKVLKKELRAQLAAESAG